MTNASATKLYDKVSATKAAGKDPIVVLDLDGTLYNNAHRTLRILQEFAHASGATRPDLVEAVDVGEDVLKLGDLGVELFVLGLDLLAVARQGRQEEAALVAEGVVEALGAQPGGLAQVAHGGAVEALAPEDQQDVVERLGQRSLSGSCHGPMCTCF